MITKNEMTLKEACLILDKAVNRLETINESFYSNHSIRYTKSNGVPDGWDCCFQVVGKGKKSRVTLMILSPSLADVGRVDFSEVIDFLIGCAEEDEHPDDLDDEIKKLTSVKEALLDGAEKIHSQVKLLSNAKNKDTAKAST